MYRPRIIPVLLLKGNGLVKTIKFRKRSARYIGDPINAVRIFNDLQADELVFLDITASLEGRCISTDLVRTIGEEAYMPFTVGGGITSFDRAKQLISMGAEKVVINTAGLVDEHLISQLAERFGSQSVVASVDIKKTFSGHYRAMAYDGTRKIIRNLDDHIRNLEAKGAGELLITSIDRDGTMEGYDMPLIRHITGLVNIPVIACGGASNLSNMADVVNEAGASAAAAGSLFVFHGNRRAVLINYPERDEIRKLFDKRY